MGLPITFNNQQFAANRWSIDNSGIENNSVTAEQNSPINLLVNGIVNQFNDAVMVNIKGSNYTFYASNLDNPYYFVLTYAQNGVGPLSLYLLLTLIQIK